MSNINDSLAEVIFMGGGGGLAGLYGTKETKGNGTNAQQENGWSLNHSAWRSIDVWVEGKMTRVISELLVEHLPFFSPLRVVGNLDPAATQFEHCSSIKMPSRQVKNAAEECDICGTDVESRCYQTGGHEITLQLVESQKFPRHLQQKRKSEHVKEILTFNEKPFTHFWGFAMFWPDLVKL